MDTDDYETISQHKWCFSHGYAFRSQWTGDKYISIYMHRLIAKTQPGYETDHINGDPLDNRKGNLRSATRLENSYNGRAHKDSLVGVKGVGFSKSRRLKPYRVQIQANKKQHFIGRFATVEEASKAYADAAHKYHGEFAKV